MGRTVFKTKKVLLTGLLLVGFLLHFVLGLRSAQVETPTVDEFAHVPAGLAYWEHGDFFLYGKNPPIVKLWLTSPLVLGAAGALSIPPVSVPAHGWGPWMYGTQFEKQNSETYLKVFTIARLMNLLLAMITALLIYFWARQTVELELAVIVCWGFLLSPTVLAHAHLATVDIGATMLIFAFCFLAQRLSSESSPRQTIFLGVTLGAALTAKFTVYFCYP